MLLALALALTLSAEPPRSDPRAELQRFSARLEQRLATCLLYTSDAADE